MFDYKRAHDFFTEKLIIFCKHQRLEVVLKIQSAVIERISFLMVN